MKKWLRISGTAMLCLMAAGMVSVKSEAKTVREKDPITLFVGESKTITQRKKNKNYRWSSANKKVATITRKGKITGKKVGKTTVTMKIRGSKYIFKVEVYKQPLVKKELSLVVGQKFKLKVEAGGKITYKSSNKKVVTVSKTGRVTAKKAGKAVVTARAKLKTYRYTIYVEKKEEFEEEELPAQSEQKEPEISYTYKIGNLNCTYGTYSHCPYAIKITTDNTKADSIIVECKEDVSYWDVSAFPELAAKGNENANNHLVPVEGGFLLPVRFDTAGTKHIVFKEKTGAQAALIMNYQIEINSYEETEISWIKGILEMNGMSGKTPEEKSAFAEEYVNTFYTVVSGEPTTLAETAPYWITKKVTEEQKRQMMEKFARQ